ncbi:AraC family transcriptional regulator [Ferrimonas lipolytica]|uniref:AraC family transcriptional regulator n=1 Tax=Ferrimonas lipolytica TaxID=2724191 RepID=A0A6H1UBA3_9GAMM|nr:helix-turn-helix transcriptional regulator [Ferrimonas lipolytica]QIZ76118.1 AraC family transcriptional regulator [Ferrimonas lipolytica]
MQLSQDTAAEQYRYPLPFDTQSEGIYLLRENYAPETQFSAHQHPWGQLNVVESGVLEFTINDSLMLSPPQYAIWIPPNTTHSSYSRRHVAYRAVFISVAWSKLMPSKPCMIKMTPLLRAVLADLGERGVAAPQTDADLRLGQVLLDQLLQSEAEPVYLPWSKDAMLEPILSTLEREPDNNRTLSAWAAYRHTTERTLARRFQKQLQMSFVEWRSRLRFLTAIGMLRQGLPIKEVALNLGFSTSSAFIAQFRRHGGMSPEQYRRERNLLPNRL